jgi:hypothetical protein
MGHGRDGFGTPHLRSVGFPVPGVVPRPFGPRARPMSGSKTNSFKKKYQIVQSLIQLLFFMSHIQLLFFMSHIASIHTVLYTIHTIRRSRSRLKWRKGKDKIQNWRSTDRVITTCRFGGWVFCVRGESTACPHFRYFFSPPKKYRPYYDVMGHQHNKTTHHNTTHRQPTIVLSSLSQGPCGTPRNLPFNHWAFA